MPAVMEMWETEDDQYVFISPSRFARRLSPHSPVMVDRTNDDNITQLTSMLHAHEMKLLTQRNMFSDLRSYQSTFACCRDESSISMGQKADFTALSEFAGKSTSCSALLWPSASEPVALRS